MGFSSSLDVCMDSSSPNQHWLQGTTQEETGMDSSSSPSGMPTRRPPPQDQALNKCPRCDSSHTKFCYYNNYSLTQPRYFCKSCRRYWTKGGTLRNIPVGGTCRKNTTKKPSSKNKSNDQQPPTTIHHQNQSPLGLSSSNNHPKELLPLSSYQDVQFPHIHNLLENPNFMEGKYYNSNVNVGMLDQNNPSRPMNFDLFGVMNSDHVLPSNYQAFGGMSLNSNYNNMMEYSSCNRLMLPYHDSGDNSGQNDVKPNPRMLSLEWQDLHDHGKELPFNGGYLNGPAGSWTGVINGYGSSTTNPLV